MSYYSDASLVLIPSGYKDQKVYSAKPTDGSGDLVFSRASDATRVDSNGLIEKVRTNLLLQSNTFNTTWTNTDTTETSGQAGYDGTNNAWLLDKSAASGFIEQSISLSGLATYSVYVKAATATWVRLLAFVSGFSTDGSAYINLSNGTVGVTSNLISTKVDSIGNGWYRVSIVPVNSPIASVRIYPAEANSIAASSGNILIQNAQLEAGDIATDYIPTAAAAVSVGPVSGLPRLDYSGGCPSLLLEPQRTNLVLNTSFRTGWLFLSGGSMSYNTSVSPDGYTNAETLVGDGVNPNAAYTSVSVTSGTLYTFSVFAKANTQSLFRMRGFSVAAGGNINFDLSNGTISGATTDDDIIRSEIQDYGNGWYRCICVFEADGTGSALFGFDRAISSSGNLFDVYGPQIEAGSYATSYIPTLGAAVSRVRDEFNTQTTPIANAFTDNTKGTVFFDLDNIELPNSANAIFRFGNSSSSLQFAIYFDTVGLGVYSYNGGAYVINTATTTKKFAIRFDGTQIVGFSNGVKRNTVNTGTSFDIDQMGSNNSASGSFVIKQFILFPSLLTDQQCIELTTL